MFNHDIPNFIFPKNIKILTVQCHMFIEHFPGKPLVSPMEIGLLLWEHVETIFFPVDIPPPKRSMNIIFSH